MMTGFFLFGGILLAWIFGRNNFSNVFGTSVGTGILSLKFSAMLTGIFLFLGTLLNSSAISNTVLDLSHFTSLTDACSFSLIVAIVMLLLTKCGVPASIAQISVGALVGWNLALKKLIRWNQVIDIILGWFYSPLISCIMAFIIFKAVRLCLEKYPVPILYRDIWVRTLWIIVGSFTAYSLGANNMPVLTIPFVQTFGQNFSVLLVFSLAVGLGCIMASKKVIKMVSHKLFPLSSVESLIVSFSSALTLLLFSFQSGFLPALPISISAALIGSIVGVSIGKGGYGLKRKVLISIIASWIWAPLFSGLLCFGFMTIISLGRF